MVERYRSSTSVATAPVARPRESGQAILAEAVHGVANQALSIAQKKIEERNAALESAALNSARIELEKRGGELASELQKGRVAGSDYVKDLEKERSKLKDEIWSKLPTRVQRSTRARTAFDDIWTNDQIQSTRAATAWQASEEKNFVVRTLNDGLAATQAKVEANPEIAKEELDRWLAYMPTYSGLLDEKTLADARSKGEQAIVQGAVRGLARKGDFERATALIEQAAPKMDPAVVEDVRAEVRAEKTRQETELNKVQRLNANRLEVDIIDGKVGRQQIDAAVSAGHVNENDKPGLIRALREEQDRREREANLDAADKAAWADGSLDALQKLETMPTSLWMMDPEAWEQAAPQAYALYQRMDRDRRRTVRQKHLDFIEKGASQDSAMATYRDLVARARRRVPEDWKLSTETVMGEGEGLEFSSRLYALAKRHAEETGGKAVADKDAREMVARALTAYRPPTDGFMGMGASGFALPPDLALKDVVRAAGGDADLAAEIYSRLARRLGRNPTSEEVMSAYRAIEGGQ